MRRMLTNCSRTMTCFQSSMVSVSSSSRMRLSTWRAQTDCSMESKKSRTCSSATQIWCRSPCYPCIFQVVSLITFLPTIPRRALRESMKQLLLLSRIATRLLQAFRSTRHSCTSWTCKNSCLNQRTLDQERRQNPWERVSCLESLSSSSISFGDCSEADYEGLRFADDHNLFSILCLFSHHSKTFHD